MEGEGPLSVIERRIRKKIYSHLLSSGFIRNQNGTIGLPVHDKESIRLSHLSQRKDKQANSARILKKGRNGLLGYFASGNEITPGNISPILEPIAAGTKEADLFRLATLTWSIPVSEGYGRRMRFLVWDEQNGKLMGAIALGDPVFNLNPRARVIGWQADDRKERLVNMMDAYVLGALPPYNMLLGGKLLACMIRTVEIRDYFSAKYWNSSGVISGKKKRPSLLAVTTTSALGRSSIYNRLRLGKAQYFEPIGFTAGFGHFHFPDDIFNEMLEYLKIRKHKYYNNHGFGEGPNWRLRVIKKTLSLMGMDHNLIHHGIRREIFICRLAQNADMVLKGVQKKPEYNGLLSVREVTELALERWVCPRSNRRPEYLQWQNKDLVQLFDPDSLSST